MTLTLNRLTKKYQGALALDDVSLSVVGGERVALLGHNGAGKSTMMKIILGLIPFDNGDVTVMGAGPGSAVARANVAYLPENVAFHPALTGLEQVGTYLRLRGEDGGQALALLERVGLHGAAKRRIGTYSKGMRQRVGLAQALIGRPNFWCWMSRHRGLIRCRGAISMRCWMVWPPRAHPFCCRRTP